MDEIIASRVVEIALALDDCLGQKHGLYPLLTREVYSYDVEKISREWDALSDSIAEIQEKISADGGSRIEYCKDLLTSFAMMVREGKGEDISYADRLNAYIQVPANKVDESHVNHVRNKLISALHESGFKGEFIEAINDWKKSQVVKSDDLLRLGNLYMEESLERCTEMNLGIPYQHTIDLQFPSNYPYRGYSNYQGGYRGQVFMSADIEWQRAGLKQVVMHESIPGHQAFSAIREKLYRSNLLGMEGTLYFANTPFTALVEGICEVGQQIVGLLTSSDDIIYDLYNRYTSAVATNLCFSCHLEDMNPEEAKVILMEFTGVSKSFADQKLGFIMHPVWCTSFPHYWYGRELIRKVFNDSLMTPKEILITIYSEPHTVRTFCEKLEIDYNTL
tara:strand:- start:865 stop:2037 length:1173 start_codon:yes stop_codon:yes gene_type:complete